MTFPGQHMPTSTADQRKAKSAAYDEWLAVENERIRRQRIYLTAIRGKTYNALIKRMLARAWDLLDANECEAADALLEFVPAADAEALMREYFPEAY